MVRGEIVDVRGVGGDQRVARLRRVGEEVATIPPPTFDVPSRRQQVVRQQPPVLAPRADDQRGAHEGTTSIFGSGNSMCPPAFMYAASRSIRFRLKCHGSTRK